MIEYRLDKVLESEREILFRLLQYSLFEESKTDFNEMNEEALYEYKWFDNYFCEESRHAFFIREVGTNKLLGFVMINQYLQKYEEGHSIAEFMILPKYRRQKIGKRVAVDIFNLYKGNWEVSPSLGSEKAYTFWKNIIDEYTDGNNKYEDGIFLFMN